MQRIKFLALSLLWLGLLLDMDSIPGQGILHAADVAKKKKE